MDSTKLTRRNLLVIAGCGLTFSPKAQAQNILPGSTIWVWRDCILSETKLKEFIETYNIKTLFLFVTPQAARALISKNELALNRVKALRDGNRQIYAVCGEPEWSWGNTALAEHARLLIDLAKTSTLFDGLHFDVEPQALPEWNNPQLRRKLIKGTLSFFKLVRDVTQDIEIDIAVNPIFNTLQFDSSSLLKEMTHYSNSFSIMSYRSNIDKAINWARPSIIEIENHLKEWRMGVLISDGEPGTSWRNTPEKIIYHKMKELDRRLLEEFGSRFYRGIAYHDYDALLLKVEN